MSWIEIRSTYPAGLVDLSPFIDIYRDFGVENTLEVGPSLSGCLPSVGGSAEQGDKLADALREAGALEVETRELPEENWDALWRQHFKPRRVGKRLVVCPSWEEFAAGPDDLVIVLDPGQAFGTGEHTTTRLCLEMLEGLDLEGRSVLDLGCGSGILSIAALKLGAKSVSAIDIDPIAVEVSRENAARNGVIFEAEVGDGFAPDHRYDVVVSNIISATLIRLASQVRPHLAPGGPWVVSGVIEQNWPDVLAAARAAGFEVVDARHEEGWVAAHFEAL